MGNPSAALSAWPAISPLIRPNRFPGIDLSNPLTASLRFSGIAASGNFINLKQGTRGTIVGSPTSSVNGWLGQATLVTGSGTADGLTFGGQSTAADTSVTVAGIVEWTSGSGYRHFFSSTSANVGGVSIGTHVSGRLELFVAAVAENVAPTVTPANNIPYFVAISASPSITNFLLKRLDTGSLSYEASTSFTPGAPNGTYYVGNGLSGFTIPFNGIIASVMFSARYMTMQEMLQWSNDPWSFWYPSMAIGGARFQAAAQAPGGTPFDPSPVITQSFRVINY